MARVLTPKTWGGHDINDGINFEARFVVGRQEVDSIANPPADAVLVDRPRSEPVFAFGQLNARRIDIEIRILAREQAEYENPSLVMTLIDQLKGWFDPEEGEQFLVVEDANERETQILALPEDMQPTDTAMRWQIKLRAAQPKRESTTDTETSDSITTAGQTLVLPRLGNARTLPSYTLTPTAAMSASDGPTNVRRVYVANRSAQPLTDFNGEKYAIDISEGAFSSPGDDLRVYLYGEEQPRWVSGDKVWVNLHCQTGRFATLAGDLAMGGTDLSVSDPTGFGSPRWPSIGWAFIGDEPVLYTLDGVFGMTLLYRPEPTGHSAGDQVVWIEHVLEVVYGESSPATPPTWLDSKPRINLADSDNTMHVWDGAENFLPDHDRRSRSWRRVTEIENSPHVRMFDESESLVYEDLPPEAGKGLSDTAEMRFPVPLIGPLELDFDIGLSLQLYGSAYDLAGYVSELINELWSHGPQANQDYSLSSGATLLRLRARLSAIAGELDETLPASDQILAPGTIGRNILDYSGGDGETPLTVYAQIYAAIHFNLEEATEIETFALKFSADGTVNFRVYNEDLTKIVTGGTFVAVAGEIVFALPPGLTDQGFGTLPAGGYWLINDASAGQGFEVVVRTKPEIYTAYKVKPEDLISTDATDPLSGPFVLDSSGDHDIKVREVDFPEIDLSESGTPIFAVISKKAEPQTDAPLETGYQIVIDNISAPLDPDSAPKIYAAPQESLFFLNGQLLNEDTGQYASLLFPCRVNEGLEINSETGQATDLQTGQSASYAVNWSDAISRLYLHGGSDNILSLSLIGDGPVTVETTYKDKWN